MLIWILGSGLVLAILGAKIQMVIFLSLQKYMKCFEKLGQLSLMDNERFFAFLSTVHCQV